MKRIRIVLAATLVIAGSVFVTSAHAVPPTATPSPGYDARLKESRAGTTIYTPAPRPSKTYRKKRVQ